MHIILGLITTIAGAIWALYYLHNAVNLNSFNPFYWMRRRRWEKQLGTKPLHRLENPMEGAAVLVVAAAEAEGKVTQEVRGKVIALFGEEFKVSKREAQVLYAASSHLLKDVVNIVAEVPKVLAPTKEMYKDRHADSLIRMLCEVAESDGDVSDTRRGIVHAVKSELNMRKKTNSTW